LMILKLGAASERLKSEKGSKDAIDVLGILFYSGFEMKTFSDILYDYKMEKYASLLHLILNEFDKRDLKYLNLNENGFSKLRKKYLEEIKKIG